MLSNCQPLPDLTHPTATFHAFSIHQHRKHCKFYFFAGHVGPAWDTCTTAQTIAPQWLQDYRGTVGHKNTKNQKFFCIHIFLCSYTHIPHIWCVWGELSHTQKKTAVTFAPQRVQPWDRASHNVPRCPSLYRISASFCSSSSSTEGSTRQKHSVGMPLIRLPRVLFRPLVSIRWFCFR